MPCIISCPAFRACNARSHAPFSPKPRICFCVVIWFPTFRAIFYFFSHPSLTSGGMGVGDPRDSAGSPRSAKWYRPRHGFLVNPNPAIYSCMIIPAVLGPFRLHFTAMSCAVNPSAWFAWSRLISATTLILRPFRFSALVWVIPDQSLINDSHLRSFPGGSLKYDCQPGVGFALYR